METYKSQIYYIACHENLSHQMKLNLDMAKKWLDWHTLAPKLLVAFNGNLSHQMKLNLDMAKKRLDWHTLAATRKTQPVLKHLSLPRYHSTIKGTGVTRFFASGFFLEPVSPKPLTIPFGPFQIFSKIRGDIRSSRFATGVNETGGKWKKPSSRKILIILFGHLWVVELTYM